MGRKAVKIKDLSGQKIERWSISDKYKRVKGSLFWWCKCECGTEKWVLGYSLTSRQTGGCIHCAKFRDLSGQKFGRWTVQNKNKKPLPSPSVRQWLCKCECGTIRWVASGDLLSAHSRSCGCLKKEVLSLTPGKAAQNQVLRGYKRKIKKSNLEWKITNQYALDLMSQNCNYCGAKPGNESISKGHNGSFIYNGIDRVDNTIGYTKENCVTCCKTCNLMKKDMDVEDFYAHIKQIIRTQYKKTEQKTLPIIDLIKQG